MAIGTAAAIGLGVAGLGAGASAISSNKASARAADTSQQNNAANNALAREIYGNNQQVLNPFMQRGNAAGNQINALLGLGGPMYQGGPEQMQLPMPNGQPNALSQFLPTASTGQFAGYNGPIEIDGPAAMQDARGFVPAGNAGLPYGLGDGFMTTGTVTNGIATANPQAGLQQPTQGQTAQQAANDAFDIFRNSTGYQFRLNEGLDAVNSGYAGAGVLQSGAALRGITEYGQNFASNEFNNYLNALGAQQAVGAGAASSLAGVGQNYASQVIGNNNANAMNQMNAQLARGNNNVFGNLAGIVGGGLFQYGLGG